MQHKSFALSVKQLGEDGTFKGVLSTYGNVDLQGDVCDAGCFTKSLQESSHVIPLLAHHDAGRFNIGALKLTDTPGALLVDGTLNLGLKDGQEARSAMLFNIANGIKTGMSIGFLTVKDEIQRGVRHLKELKLFEGSLVTFPANPLAGVAAAKSLPALATATREQLRKEVAEIFARVDVYGGHRR